jgi:flavin reductase (DIM6/NTAB) family NADH-FMN oxidoreductase RutF
MPLIAEPAARADLPADPRLFREGMSRVAGAVHIISTAGPAGRAGFTATAVASVSDDPPTLLVCLNATSRVWPVLEANGRFAVNTLRAGDGSLADVFAGRTGASGESRFASGDWQMSQGLPLLRSALVHFGCRLVEARQIATHRVLIGAVEQVELAAAGAGLVYKGRAYHAL